MPLLRVMIVIVLCLSATPAHAAAPRPGDEFAGGPVHTSTTQVDGAEYRVEIQFFKAPHNGEVWKAVGRDRAGRIYLGNSTQDENSYVYRLDPKTGKLRYLGDLLSNVRVGKPGGTDNGKIHSTFAEGPDGSMYFLSHQGWREPLVYGGHLWKLDPKNDRIADLGVPMPRNTSLCLSQVDPTGRFIYASGSPSGYLYRYELKTGQFTALLPTGIGGVRFLPMDADGNVYIFGDNEILRYGPADDRLATVVGHNEDPAGERSFSGAGAYCWTADRKRIYFLSYKKAMLFAWDIGAPRVAVLGRLHPDGTDLYASNLHVDAAGRRLYALCARDKRGDKGFYMHDLARHTSHKLLAADDIIEKELDGKVRSRFAWVDFQDCGGVTGDDGTMYTGFWGGGRDKDVDAEGESFAALVATRVTVKERP